MKFYKLENTSQPVYLSQHPETTARVAGPDLLGKAKNLGLAAGLRIGYQDTYLVTAIRRGGWIAWTPYTTKYEPTRAAAIALATLSAGDVTADRICEQLLPWVIRGQHPQLKDALERYGPIEWKLFEAAAAMKGKPF
jgi:hypothetical protein